jgi:acyl carrier protein
MDDIKTPVRDFIICTYLPGESPDNLRPDMPLLSSGILDSLALLGVVSFLEERFCIELDVYDTRVENFDSIEDIARCVAAKQVAPAPVRGASKP